VQSKPLPLSLLVRTVLLLAVVAFPLASAQEASPGNHPLWRSMGGYPGTNGPVHCSAVDAQGNLYIGGSFVIAGDVRSHSVAKWDGVKWTSISPPLTNGGTVFSLAFDSQGNLYAGGSFRDIGGIAALRIARWNGSQWQALGTGLGYNGNAWNMVKAIAISPEGQVYAGGVFASSGSTTVNNIARWDGSNWNALGQGVVDSSPSVNALTFDAAGNLYATGQFNWAKATNGTSLQVYSVARWNGSAWSGLGTGLGANPSLGFASGSALKFDNSGNLIVAGRFSSAGGVTTDHIARWNGTSWSTFGTGLGQAIKSPGVMALAVTSEGEVVAASKSSTVGDADHYELMRWNGSAWVNAIPHPAVGGAIRTFQIMPNGNYILGGDFKKLGTGDDTFSASHLVRWDGTRFHRFGSGPDGIVRVAKFAANDDLIVGGDFRTIGGIQAAGIARYDGNRWWPYGSGIEGEVYEFVFGNGDELYVGGLFASAGGVASRSIARWDGTQWQAFAGGGLTKPLSNPSVMALALAADGTLYIGGSFSQTVDGTLLSGIASWKDGVWNNLKGGCLTSDSTPVPRNGAVLDLLIDHSGHLIAGGSFARMGTDPGETRDLARWDGNKWNYIADRSSSGYALEIECMAMSPSGILHVANDYNWYLDSIYRLNANNTWSTIGNSFEGRVHSFIFGDDGRIYAGGLLGRTGSSILPRHSLYGITYWNGTRWSSLGNGGLGLEKLSPDVVALAIDSRGNLILGGDFFGSADGVVSPFLIRTRTNDYGLWPVLGSLPPDRLGPLDQNGPLGLQNLAAYAMGLDPFQATPSDLPRLVLDEPIAAAAGVDPSSGKLMAGNASSPTMKFRYRRSRVATGISTQIVSSSDLIKWEPAQILTSGVVEQQPEWELLEVTMPREGNANFIRLKVGLEDDF